MHTILIVDDDSGNLVSLKMLLKYSGIKGLTIKTASNVGDALTILSRNGVDLVLSDVNLGSEYGPDIKRAYPRVPFIYLTGDTHWKSPDKSVMLAKPYDADVLYGHVKSHLGIVENIEENIFRLTRMIANQEITVEDAIKDLLEVAPPGWSGTVKAMKDKEGFPAKKAFSLAWWMHKRGDKPHYSPEAGKPKYKKPVKIHKT